MRTAPDAARRPQFTLGDRLRKARETAGYDRQAFAALIGIHRESLAHYEQGRQVPRPPVITAWALAAGVDVEWLRNGDTPGPMGTGGESEPPIGIEPMTYSLLGDGSRYGWQFASIGSPYEDDSQSEWAA